MTDNNLDFEILEFTENIIKDDNLTDKIDSLNESESDNEYKYNDYIETQIVKDLNFDLLEYYNEIYLFFNIIYNNFPLPSQRTFCYFS